VAELAEAHVQNLVPMEFRFDPDNWYQIVLRKDYLSTFLTFCKECFFIYQKYESDKYHEIILS
jgi:hypothetical protein